MSPDPGFGLRLGGSRSGWLGDSDLRLFRLCPVPSPAPACEARLLEEVPPVTPKATQNAESCEWSGPGKGVDASGDRVRWSGPGVEARAVRVGGEARAVRDPGEFLRKKFLPQPRSSPSRVPGLASVPRSHRHLQPRAPAHMGLEAGGAPGTLSLIPRLLRGDPPLCRRGPMLPFGPGGSPASGR